jgi:hypothetical protein
LTAATTRRKRILHDPRCLPSPFELAAAELRALGITLARLPGEYRVNFHNAGDATARTAETLDEALAVGQSMAADAPAPVRPAQV